MIVDSVAVVRSTASTYTSYVLAGAGAAGGSSTLVLASAPTSTVVGTSIMYYYVGVVY